MSNIYINEPQTHGKVYLKTTVGDIDIELWSREAPKACRNFVQLCMEGYYNNTIFHRVVKGFIAQGGDPTGTGLGGESIYGAPFRDEFHSRLRFVRRGLVAMANAGKDDNGSQFFFTLGNCQELQNKHTIFGKVTGKTLFNMLKLEDSLVDRNERPKYPQKIISTEILSNPFPDIVPRIKKEEKKIEKKSEVTEMKGKKDFKLLSFGDEAEEEEEEMMEVVKEFKGKSKSSHDLLKNDPKLSSIPAVDTSIFPKSGNKDDVDDEKERKKRERLERIKRKLERKEEKSETKELSLEEPNFDFLLDSVSEKRRLEEQKLEETKKEFELLKKQIKSERKRKVEVVPEQIAHDNPAVEAFRQEARKYKEAAKSVPKKGSTREEQTLAIMEKFRSRIQQQQKISGESEDNSGPVGNKEETWIAHELKCQKEYEGPVLAKDANMRGEGEWYDIYDPRNPINKRRREGVLLPEEMEVFNKK
ncbi:peptidyl-prolyl cis-trans isomerase sdccag10-like protein [Leptotrombidium deliense]|uniref:Spliceosome-associated protein CWC27 homolog n=1 Tax=Leptotrombidium deliense TaxID=299467 RepID=A0A443SPD6_9ACAR|nr:peptidyl-prolyl cis-trans isomerase sdccag10-like protein [Leptotrombidium deliense]